jgi:hypothetical protein
MGTTHFTLRQAQDVLQQEWADIEEEWQLLRVGLPPQERTTSEKQQAVVKRELLNKMKAMLKQEEVTIGILDSQA